MSICRLEIDRCMDLMRLHVPEATAFIGDESIIVKRGYKPVIVYYGLESTLDGIGVFSEVLDYGVV